MADIDILGIQKIFWRQTADFILNEPAPTVPAAGHGPHRWKSDRCGSSRQSCDQEGQPASPHHSKPCKTSGKEVPKIMGKNLGGRNPRLSAQRLHFRPYLFPGQPAPASGEKDLARGNFIFTGSTSAASGTAFGAIGWCVSSP